MNNASNSFHFLFFLFLQLFHRFQQGYEDSFYLCCQIKLEIMTELRKLKITEMNRKTVEEFKEARKIPLVVVLDQVRSLHNIGAVFRTADAFLVDKIYLCGITATPPHPELHKTALGAEFTVDWKYFKNTQDAVNDLHKDGYVVLAIEQCEGSTMLDDLILEKDKKYAIVFGNEVKGVQQEVVNSCDGCIEIPQYGTKHSLNVSVTAGIVLWECARRLIRYLSL
ncbi:RNA methyltransferase, TrmH family [Phocaeicola coprophilus DSM 18228 = JCM 13818]|uniref:RNA methyltransferase, TrmH family n=1 Tax=Phocaeicola coprophilus DSM 18228 = JCM 13818 TaxID=547042 RepID=S0F598_9BACT|nr:RNA methyltransferase, TrmH family [Phocaeicola coprophilus DSM 18228 = JCM 13818]